LTARMQYTATSFAEPLQRVFDDVLRPDTDIEVTHHEQSRYLVKEVNVRSGQLDAVEQRLYDPLLRAVRTWAGFVRWAHPGSVNVYLAYGAIGLLVVLLVAR
jgi:hydrogenase-4 component B